MTETNTIQIDLNDLIEIMEHNSGRFFTNYYNAGQDLGNYIKSKRVKTNE